MGKFKKLKESLIDALMSVIVFFISLLFLILALDLFGQIRNQHKIPGTHCYLQYNELYMTVNLVYKYFPVWTKEKMLLEKDILEVYWNENEDIIAVDYMKSGQIDKYYLLLRSSDRGRNSPLEPYTIMCFNSEDYLWRYLEMKYIKFEKRNHYFWDKGT